MSYHPGRAGASRRRVHPSLERRGVLETVLSLALALFLSVPAFAQTKQFRICADPENMPFSNRQLEGFENKIAGLIAKEFGATPRYVWWGQRRGFIRNT